MDSVYLRDCNLIDIVDREWILDKIPFADVNVPLVIFQYFNNIIFQNSILILICQLTSIV